MLNMANFGLYVFVRRNLWKIKHNASPLIWLTFDDYGGDAWLLDKFNNFFVSIKVGSFPDNDM